MLQSSAFLILTKTDKDVEIFTSQSHWGAACVSREYLSFSRFKTVVLLYLRHFICLCPCSLEGRGHIAGEFLKLQLSPPWPSSWSSLVQHLTMSSVSLHHFRGNFCSYFLEVEISQLLIIPFFRATGQSHVCIKENWISDSKMASRSFL